MSGSPSNSPDTSAPFFLRGSSSVFSQRQMDVFGSLQALEDAHKKVTKETKAERHLVKKMTWRTTKPAVESLEAEKDAVSCCLRCKNKFTVTSWLTNKNRHCCIS